MAAALAAMAAPAPAQVVVPVDVEDPRPLAAAADQVQLHYAVPISYEDPPYSHPDDLVPMSSPSAGATESAGNSMLIPAGTGLEMAITAEEPPVMFEPGEALTELTALHAAQDEPGRFRIVQAGEIFQIIPEQVKQANGELAPITPVLDTPILLYPWPRSCLAAVKAIRKKLKRAGQPVELGRLPTQLLRENTVTVGGLASARDMLLEVVEALPYAVSWRLLYDANMETYFLSMVVVRTRGTTVVGVTPPP